MMELISAQRRTLADVLDTLTPEQWRGTTMCAGWTPGHVLAHLTMPFRISEQEFMQGLMQAGGDFTKFSDEIADRDCQLPQSELVGILRDNADNPWTPPGGGAVGALSHDLIHGLDITWPLPVDFEIQDEAMSTVLDSMISPGTHTYFGVPLEGVMLSATDLDWTAGSGALLAGRSRDLLMLLTGRHVPSDLFCGDGIPLMGGVGAR